MVRAGLLVVEQGAAERTLGALAAGDPVLLRREHGRPLGVGLDDLVDERGFADAALAVVERDEHLGYFGFGGIFHGLGFGRGGGRYLLVAGGGEGEGEYGEGENAGREEPGFHIHGVS